MSLSQIIRGVLDKVEAVSGYPVVAQPDPTLKALTAAIAGIGSIVVLKGISRGPAPDRKPRNGGRARTVVGRRARVVNPEVVLVVGLFASGALAGLLSRWGPLSGWAALAFPLVLPAAGLGLARLFC